MLDPEIERFFSERKDLWLKKMLKAEMRDEEKKAIEQECNELFALKNWSPNAAKRAGQMSISTHPCTFTHPSARKNKNGYVSSVIASAERKSDGFLRSGNVHVEPDALGNAAVLDVYKFLTLVMRDGKSLLSHIQDETPLARALLNDGNDGDEGYAELRAGFLQMVAPDSDVITSSKIKQVYFPVAFDDYHQLSLLTNSGLLFELRKRIDAIRFSEQQKELRELKRSNQYSESGFDDIYGITTIGFGGTKPQNISVLNNQYAGKAHLLLSCPPELKSGYPRLPKRNFFPEIINPWQVKEIFDAYLRLLKTDYNNINIREGRDYRVEEYFDYVVQRMWQVRISFDEYSGQLPESLPAYQKIWLFPEKQNEREETNEWLDTLVSEIARSFIFNYEKVSGQQVIKLGDSELNGVIQVIDRNKDALR